MNFRVWENPWRLMLAVNAAVLIGVFWHKIALPPFVPYIHLLVDYHFGFTKRALIGAIVGAVHAPRCRCGWCSRSAARCG